MEEEEIEEDSDEDDDDLEPFEHPKNKRLLQLGRTLSRSSDSDDSCSTLSAASSDAGTPSSQATDDSLPDIPSLALDSVDPAFHREAAASLARAFAEQHSVENARLELRTLVMGYNAGIDAAREECTSFLMSQIQVSPNPAALLASVTAIWKRWGELVTSHASETTNIPLDVQSYCVKHDQIRPYFGIVLRGLYESDVIDEEDLIEWRSLSQAQGEGTADLEEKILWKDTFAKGKAYVDVLEDMDSESEEEDEEDDDSDE
jgi:translation initiation factor eIF-2B subunit epsilon